MAFIPRQLAHAAVFGIVADTAEPLQIHHHAIQREAVFLQGLAYPIQFRPIVVTEFGYPQTKQLAVGNQWFAHQLHVPASQICQRVAHAEIETQVIAAFHPDLERVAVKIPVLRVTVIQKQRPRGASLPSAYRIGNCVLPTSPPLASTNWLPYLLPATRVPRCSQSPSVVPRFGVLLPQTVKLLGVALCHRQRKAIVLTRAGAEFGDIAVLAFVVQCSDTGDCYPV